MSRILYLLIIVMVAGCSTRRERLFDGQTFSGWEGDTTTIWKITDGVLAGGSLEDTVPHNDFICTTRSFSDFVLRLKFRLRGSEGFINAGVQFRSQRLADPAFEMTGYQADLGNRYWGSLYDESRRNKVLAAADSLTIANILRPNDWNDYEIRAEGRRIQLFINGTQTIDYTEPDHAIPQSGIIGLQVHGGGKALAEYKEIFIEQLK